MNLVNLSQLEKEVKPNSISMEMLGEKDCDALNGLLWKYLKNLMNADPQVSDSHKDKTYTFIKSTLERYVKRK